jgi:hypothetical protein
VDAADGAVHELCSREGPQNNPTRQLETSPRRFGDRVPLTNWHNK